MFHYCRDINRVPPKNIRSEPTVTEKQKYECEFCDKQWDSESEVVLHKVAHSKNIRKLIEQGNYVCWTCIRTYSTQEELCKHIRTMHLLSADTAVRVEREIFICNDCERVFFNKRMLIIHIANYHRLRTVSSEIYCPKCLKVRSLYKLKMHFYTHLMQSISSCPICYQKCRNATDFQTHITDVHPKYCYCNICDYTSSTLELFNKHCTQSHSVSSISVLSNHNYDKDYASRFFVPTGNHVWKYCKLMPYKGLQLQSELKICILCREICKSVDDMIKHLMQHTKVDKPQPKKTTFECQCGKQFNFKILLKQHQTKCGRKEEGISVTVTQAETYILPQYLELPPGITLTPFNNEQNMANKEDIENTDEYSEQAEIIEIEIELNERATAESNSG